MSKPERVRSAPGLVWKKRGGDINEARWQCRTDIVDRGYKVKSVKLWSRVGDPTKEEWDFIADTCRQLQDEMLAWARGSRPGLVVFNGTLSSLIHCYKTDPDSNYRRKGGLRYGSRIYYDALMGPMEREKGAVYLSEITGRTFRHWYNEWSEKGQIARAHSRIKMLRGLFKFGSTLLEEEQCARLSGILRDMTFEMPRARVERLQAHQVVNIRAKAHEMGRPSIALGQAIQFELMLRQKDVIGEWIPLSEPGVSDVIYRHEVKGQYKWLRGVRWEEINAHMVLTHVTSKKQKEISVSLRNAPMVMEELALQFPGFDPALPDRSVLPASGPIIVNEYDEEPWEALEFRRWWRQVADAAGIPKTVKNMDTRAGAISEATDAGADLEHVRHAATHSDIKMTQRYSRGSEGKIAQVQLLRLEARNKGKKTD